MEGEQTDMEGGGTASGYDYCNAGYIVCMCFFFVFFYRLILYLLGLLSAQLSTPRYSNMKPYRPFREASRKNECGNMRDRFLAVYCVIMTKDGLGIGS